MKVLKHIAVNLAVLVLVFAVMFPPAMAEGRLGHGSVEAIAFYLSVVMTVVSTLAYGVGTWAATIVRCVGAFIALWFLFSMTMFIICQKPALFQDATRYWFGTIASVIVIVFQTFYDRKHFGEMLGLCVIEW